MIPSPRTSLMHHTRSCLGGEVTSIRCSDACVMYVYQARQSSVYFCVDITLIGIGEV